MSDDSTSALTRRRLLAAVSSATAAGIAGCAGTLGQSDTETPGNDSTASGTQTPTDTGETATPSNPTYAGETIPPTTYDELASIPPTTVAPAAKVTNPVLTADDVTDFGNVDYVADPYIFIEEGTWHVFFEVVNDARSPDAAIGHATSSDGLDWEYEGIILEKAEHTSYPFVWKHNGEYYMSPPTGQSIDLWRATSFPTDWERMGTVLEEDYFTHDPVFVKRNDRWWLFTDKGNENVMAFHSEELTASPDAWTPHANNPVVTDRRRAARQGGRPVVLDDTLYLFFQDLEYEYGGQVRAFRVTELTPDTYSDEEVEHSPVLTGFGDGWNSVKMHHIDPWALGDDNGWRCAVDGAFDRDGDGVTWGIGIFDAPNTRDPDPSAIPYDPEQTSGYFRLDGQSTVAVDDAGNQNHGMIRGTTTSTVGGCPGRRFEKESDRIVFPTTFETIGSDEYTLFFRGSLSAPKKPQTLFSYTSRHIPTRLAVRYDPDLQGWTCDFDADSRVQPEIDAPVSQKEPFQLAVTYKRGEGYRVVQDGTELTTTRDVGTPFHEVALPVVGGTLAGQFPWQGDVSHVGVFDTALSNSELSSIASSVCSN